MAGILVVVYSRTGHTHGVAQRLAQAFGADLERIVDLEDRRGRWGFLRSAVQSLRRRAARIEPPTHDPSAYDLVVLGSPVWAGHVSTPMRRYLSDQAGKLKRVALFVTEGGSGGPTALADMAELAGRKPVATMVLREKDIEEGLRGELDRFVGRVKNATAHLAAS